MISEAFQAIELLLKLYNKKEQRSQLERHLKRTLLRELALNKELIREALETKTDDPQACNQFIEATKTDAFAAISNLGLPLEEMFSNNWKVAGTYPANGQGKASNRKKFLHLTGQIRTEIDLLERTYHRLTVQKIRAQINEKQDAKSLNYLGHLLYESVELLRSKVGVGDVQQS